MTNIIVRFAPSPTGNLHIGNIRTALVNFLFARKNAGKFMLRIDDTDIERSKEIFELNIKEDLKWLKLDWDLEERQSKRIFRYKETLDYLIKIGRAYECFETQEELDLKRKSLLMSGKPPIYDRSSLQLSDEEKSNLLMKGRKPHYRFLLKNENVCWDDLIKGKVNYHMSNISDPVLVREDGRFIYTLASVVDDIDFKISTIIRGEDHVTNSAAQIQIFRALKAKIPQMAHLALMTGSEGQELSKRLGSLSISTLKDKEIDSISILSLLSTIGTSDPITLIPNLQNIISKFDVTKFGTSPAKFDINELLDLNTKFIQSLKFHDVKEHLIDNGVNNINEKFWELIKHNIQAISDVKIWWSICNEEIMPVIENNEIISSAIKNFPSEEFDADVWKKWIANIKSDSRFNGKEIFMSLRLAITGKSAGPDVGRLISFIEKERLIKRLSGLKS